MKSMPLHHGMEIVLKKIIPVSESLQAFFLPDAICHYASPEVDYLCMFSPKEKGIIFFNLQTQKIDRTVIPQDFAHRIKRPVGLYVHSIDTMVLLEQETQHLIFLNAQGKITEEIDVKWDLGLSPHPPAPQLSMTNPLCFANGYIYMTGYSGGEFPDEKIGSRPVIIRIGPGKDMKTYLADYPAIYYK